MKISSTTELALLLALACACACACACDGDGDGRPRPAEPVPAASAAATATPAGLVASEAPAPAPEPAPEPASEPASEPAPAIPPLPDGPPVPGFVVHTAEQSIVVPLDGSPPTIGAGVWVQDDRSDPPGLTHALVLSEARALALELPACACLALEGACARDDARVRRFDPRTGVPKTDPDDPDCTCIHRPDEPGFPPFVTEDGQSFEACAGGGDEGIASLVAGRLYYAGWDWNGSCYDALSLYDATSWELALVADPPPLSGDDMRRVGCYDLGPAFVERPWPIGRGASSRLDTCDGDYESEVFMLRRGYLWGVRDDIGHAHGTRTIVRRPARPDRCPSLNDPCGDPEPFQALAGLGDRRREFWIATDGSMALTAVGQRYALWRPTSPTPTELELPGVHATDDVLGVRVYADVGRLRALIERHAALGVHTTTRAPPTVEPSRCHELHRARPAAPRGRAALGRSARAWGNDCVARLRIGHWASAEASCLEGLTIATEAKTKGALLYNLGRIAEAQGAQAQALEHYRSSLAARPDDRTVKRRLAKLERAVARAAADPRTP